MPRKLERYPDYSEYWNIWLARWMNEWGWYQAGKIPEMDHYLRGLCRSVTECNESYVFLLRCFWEAIYMGVSSNKRKKRQQTSGECFHRWSGDLDPGKKLSEMLQKVLRVKWWRDSDISSRWGVTRTKCFRKEREVMWELRKHPGTCHWWSLATLEEGIRLRGLRSCEFQEWVEECLGKC